MTNCAILGRAESFASRNGVMPSLFDGLMMGLGFTLALGAAREVPDDSTVRQAIEQSGLLQQFPEIDLENQKVGIFGKLTKLDASLEEGARIEIYRPITADPELVER